MEASDKNVSRRRNLQQCRFKSSGMLCYSWMSAVQAGSSSTGWYGKLYKAEAYRGPLHFTIPSTGNTQHKF